MTKKMTAVIERYFHDLFGQGRVELVEQLLHPDYVNHSPGSPDQDTGRAGVRDVVLSLRQAFPDLRYDIDDLVVGADAVATRTTMRGSHQGPFFGTPPTGNAIEVAQLTIEHFRDGRIVAHHRLTDMQTLFAQLRSR